jgi:putative transcriptional regulator
MNNLREIRKQKGLSQLKLAYITGIAPSEISRIENGVLKPYPGWRRRLAKALATNEGELFPKSTDGEHGQDIRSD